LKSSATVVFIGHQLPKGLAADEFASLAGERSTQMRVVESDESE
jgi:hypothetical protein